MCEGTRAIIVREREQLLPQQIKPFVQFLTQFRFESHMQNLLKDFPRWGINSGASPIERVNTTTQ